MSTDWKTPLQSLITKLGAYTNGLTTQQWLVNMSGIANPYAGLVWSPGPTQRDEWGVGLIVNILAEWGPGFDIDGRFGSDLALVVAQANKALGYSSFTGDRPGNLIIGSIGAAPGKAWQ